MKMTESDLQRNWYTELQHNISFLFAYKMILYGTAQYKVMGAINLILIPV